MLTNIPINLMTLLLIVILVGSVIQGGLKGASGSARQLFMLVLEGIVTLVTLVVSWKWMQWSSPHVGAWLISRQIKIPSTDLNWYQQMYYTFITAARDFSLMRSAILFLVSYAILKNILLWLVYLGINRWGAFRKQSPSNGRNWTSTAIGCAIGSLTGVGRSLMMIALFFIVASLYPHTSFTNYIQDSNLYQKGAKEIIQPFTGQFISKQLPVFTRAVETEFNNILQRKYEVLDANVPDNIAEAAKTVTAKAATDEAKAKALYQWIGTRITYDWDKANQYEQKRIWKEQTPEDTFTSKTGVCIDYARLYAVMARAAHLDVKIVTGLGYDGKGGYGSHAWNEVYLGQKQQWVPLDSTWLSSGGDWFNPPKFYETHIKDNA